MIRGWETPEETRVEFSGHEDTAIGEERSSRCLTDPTPIRPAKTRIQPHRLAHVAPTTLQLFPDVLVVFEPVRIVGGRELVCRVEFRDLLDGHLPIAVDDGRLLL